MMENRNIHKWENVYVFISSTFNDMHAERDYLIKKVFPELSEWCSERMLKLVDIDLRWGITEEDSMINKRVVDICLNRIDDSRPFFICFLGQRRGWIPKKDDVTEDTLNRKGMEGIIGKESVTEIEIRHAVLQPFWDYNTEKMGVPVDNAFFFFRDGQYLEDIKDNLELMKIFTNLCEEDEKQADIGLQESKDNIEERCSERNHPKPIIYTGKWDHSITTPELYMPRLDEKTNKERCQGRLRDFANSEGEELKNDIINLLKDAISKEFPERSKISEERAIDGIERELIQQDQFLNDNLEGFIKRKDDFQKLNQYLNNDENNLLAIVSEAGLGKTTLVANWIKEQSDKSEDLNICYRFIGASNNTDTINNVLESLRDEWEERDLLDLDDDLYIENIDALSNGDQMKKRFYKILSSMKGNTLIIIDALNQLQDVLNPTSFLWLPSKLPPNVKMVVSFKIGDEKGDKFHKFLKEERKASILEIKPFNNFLERKKLVEEYLSKHLKALDNEKLDVLLELEATKNPLFLKIILSELRIYGSFDTLLDKIKKDFGSSPKDAFISVLNRMETDPAYCPLEPKLSVSSIFGLLSAARNGLSTNELVSGINKILKINGLEYTLDDIEESVHLFLRQLRPFLARRQNRVDFLYEAFSLASKEKYKDKEKFYHNILEQVFKDIADINQNNRWEGEIVRGFQELPYHMSKSGKYKELESILMNYCYLNNKIKLCGIKDVINDFNYFESISEELSLLYGCLAQSSHILIRDSEQLPIQLYGRMSGIKNRSIEELLRQASKETKGTWLRPTKPFLGSLKNNRVIGTLEGYIKRSKELYLYKNRLVSLDYDGFDVWDINNHELLYSQNWEYDNRGKSIVVDNKVMSMANSKIEIWNLDNQNRINTIESEKNVEIIDFAVYDHTMYIAKCKRSGKKATCYVEKWNMDNWECHGILYEENNYNLSVFAKDNHLIVCSDNIKIIDSLTGKCKFSVDGDLFTFRKQVFYKDKLIFENYDDKKIKSLDLEDGTVSIILDFHYEGQFREYEITLSGNCLFLNIYGKMGIWNLDEEKWIGKASFSAIDIMPIAQYEGKFVLVIGWDIYIVEEKSGILLDKFEYDSYNIETLLVKDNKIYCGTVTGKILIIDLLTTNHNRSKGDNIAFEPRMELAMDENKIFGIDGEFIKIFDSKFNTMLQSFHCNGKIEYCKVAGTYLIATILNKENTGMKEGYEHRLNLDLKELMDYEESKKLYSVIVIDMEKEQSFQVLKNDDHFPSIHTHEDYLIIETSKSVQVWNMAMEKLVFEYVFQDNRYKCGIRSFKDTVFIGDGDSVYIYNIEENKMRTEPIRLREIFKEEEEDIGFNKSNSFDIFGNPITMDSNDEFNIFGNALGFVKPDIYYLDDFRGDNVLIYKDNVIIQWTDLLRIINIDTMETKLNFPLRTSGVNHKTFLYENLLLAFHEGVIVIWNLDTFELITGYATPYIVQCDAYEFQNNIIIHTEKKTRILDKNDCTSSNTFRGFRVIRQDNEKLFMANDDEGQVIVWNIEENKAEYGFQVEYSGTITDIQKVRDNIWILVYKDSILVYNYEKNIIESKVIFDKDVERGIYISPWSGDITTTNSLIIDDYFYHISGTWKLVN